MSWIFSPADFAAMRARQARLRSRGAPQSGQDLPRARRPGRPGAPGAPGSDARAGAAGATPSVSADGRPIAPSPSPGCPRPTVVRPETPDAVAADAAPGRCRRAGRRPLGRRDEAGLGQRPPGATIWRSTSPPSTASWSTSRPTWWSPRRRGSPWAPCSAAWARPGSSWPSTPPTPPRATLGGTLATNASGPSRLLYGTARDLVLGMQVATPAGDLVKSGGRVVKNVVGYDLNKMHIGGLGTLGVMVEVTFKVHPLPARRGHRRRHLRRPRPPPTRSPGASSAPSSTPAPSSWCGPPCRACTAGRGLARPGLVRRLPGHRRAPGARRHRLVPGGRRHVETCAWTATTTARCGTPCASSGATCPPDTALVKLTALPTRIPDLIAAAGRAAGAQDAAPQIVAHAGSGVLYAALPGASADRPADPDRARPAPWAAPPWWRPPPGARRRAWTSGAPPGTTSP